MCATSSSAPGAGPCRSEASRCSPPLSRPALERIVVQQERELGSPPRPDLGSFDQIWCGLRSALSAVQKLELIATGRRRAGLSRIVRRTRDHLAAQSRVARQDAEVAEQMEARWRHSSDEPDHEVFSLEQQRARAILPDILEHELEPAVAATLHLGPQPLLLELAPVPLALRFGSGGARSVDGAKCNRRPGARRVTIVAIAKRDRIAVVPISPSTQPLPRCDYDARSP
jgi:hypothetical protein